MTSVRTLLLVMVAQGIFAQGVFSQAVGGSPANGQRWAILGDLSARNSGILDLVVAKLSDLPAGQRVELLEREQVDLVSSELQLASLSDPTNISGRLNARRLLSVDVLVIVTLISPGDIRRIQDQSLRDVVQVVVCDCSQGARLCQWRLVVDRQEIEQAAVNLAKNIRELHARFADGIEKIIGLSPLACDNLEHDYDYLARHYYNVLATTLSLQSGVAVLEVEEARAIAREFGSGKGIHRRQVPVFLSGNYRVKKVDSDDPSKQRQIVFEFQLDDTLTKQVVRSPNLRLASAAGWLADEFLNAPEVQSCLGNTRMTREQQTDLLVDRSELFSRLGDLDTSTRLRESLLLLDATLVDQRVQLIREYRSLIELENQRMVSFGRSLGCGVLDSEQHGPSVERIFQCHRMLMEHFEFLVFNRLINLPLATNLLSESLWHFASQDRYYSDVHVAYACALPSLRTSWDSAIAAEKRFLRQVCPRILTLMCPDSLKPPAVVRLRVQWSDAVLSWTNRIITVLGSRAEQMGFFEQVFDDVIPEGIPHGPVGCALFRVGYRYRKYKVRPIRGQPKRDVDVQFGMARDEWTQLLIRWKSDRHAHLRFYARWSLLNSAYWGELLPSHKELQQSDNREVWSDELEELWRTSLVEADSILSDLRRRVIEGVTRLRQQDAVFAKVWEHRELLRKMRGGEDPNFRHPTAYSVSHSREGPGMIKVRKFSFDQRFLTTTNFVNCDGRFDLVHDQRHIAVLQRPWELRRIFSAVGPTLKETHWDGQLVWANQGKHGPVVVLDAQGRHIARFDGSTGMPHHDVELKIHPVGPGRALATGIFGTDLRSWCALLTIDRASRKPSVKVFHQARRTMRLHANRKFPVDPRDPYLTLHNRWFCTCADGDQRYVLIGRARLFPLKVDLQSLETTVLERPISAASRHSLYYHDGRLLTAYRDDLIVHDLRTENQRRSLIRRDTFRPLSDFHSMHGRLVPYGDWLYLPGRIWYRVHKWDFRVERLGPTPIPSAILNSQVDASANFGLVAWSSGSQQHGFLKLTPHKGNLLSYLTSWGSAGAAANKVDQRSEFEQQGMELPQSVPDSPMLAWGPAKVRVLSRAGVGEPIQTRIDLPLPKSVSGQAFVTSMEPDAEVSDITLVDPDQNLVAMSVGSTRATSGTRRGGHVLLGKLPDGTFWRVVKSDEPLMLLDHHPETGQSLLATKSRMATGDETLVLLEGISEEEPRVVRRWSIPEPFKNARIQQAKLVAQDQCVVFSCGFVLSWDLKAGDLKYAIQIDADTPNALSFSRDASLMTVSRSGGFNFVVTATGEDLGRVPCAMPWQPHVKFAPRSHRVAYCIGDAWGVFDYDALHHELPQTTPWKLSGRLLGWINSELLLGGAGVVLDVENRFPLWKLQSGKLKGIRLWDSCMTTYRHHQHLRETQVHDLCLYTLPLPHAAMTEAFQQARAIPDLMLTHAGGRVRVELDIHSAYASEVDHAAIQAQVQRAVSQAGWIQDPSARVRLIAKVDAGKPFTFYPWSPKAVMERKLPLGKSNTKTISERRVIPAVSSLEVRFQEQLVWSMKSASGQYPLLNQIADWVDGPESYFQFLESPDETFFRRVCLPVNIPKSPYTYGFGGSHDSIDRWCEVPRETWLPIR